MLKINKNNKGFTLIELLAVIIILAVLMLIAVPGILNIMNKSKISAFRSQAESIYKAAEQQALVEKTAGKAVTCYARTSAGDTVSGATETLSLKGTKAVYFNVAINASTGEITSISVYDSSSKYSLSVASSPSIDKIAAAEVNENVSTSPISGCS